MFARGQRRLLSSQPSSRPRDCVHAHTSTPPEEARDNLGPRTASPSDAARSSACADDVQVAPDISASSGSRYATELHSWFGLSRQPFTSFSATEVKPETPQASAHLLSTAAIDNTATAGSVDVDDSTTDAVLAVSSAAAAGAAMEEEQAPTTASTAVAAQEEGYHEHQLDAPATPAAPEVMRRGVSVATTCPGCGAAVLDEAAIEMATGDTAKGRRNKRKLQGELSSLVCARKPTPCPVGVQRRPPPQPHPSITLSLPYTFLQTRATGPRTR